MFYKKSGENWLNGIKIALPNGIEITEENRSEHTDTLSEFGWIWHDEPPQDYLDWLEEQQINDEEE